MVQGEKGWSGKFLCHHNCMYGCFTELTQSLLCLMQQGGTLAKRAGRAQDINANNIRQTACALVSVACEQVQSKLKVRQHLWKVSEPSLGLTGSRTERVSLPYLFITTTVFTAVSHSLHKACYVECSEVALLPNVPEEHRTCSGTKKELFR